MNLRKNINVICIGLTLGACTYDFPDQDSEGVFGCKQEDDCIAGFVCYQQRCVKTVNAADCSEPQLQISPAGTEILPNESQASAPVIPSEHTVEIWAANLPSPPDPCSEQNASWWICDAPVDSQFESVSDEDCTQQDNNGNDIFSFIPDKTGAYTIQLRRPQRKDEVRIQAACRAAHLRAQPGEVVDPQTLVTIQILDPPNDTHPCGLARATWWVCDAPDGSSYYDKDSRCLKQNHDGQSSMSFTPDVPGSYAIELRRHLQIDTLTVVGNCEHINLITQPNTGQVYVDLEAIVSTPPLPTSPVNCSAVTATWWICENEIIPCHAIEQNDNVCTKFSGTQPTPDSLELRFRPQKQGDLHVQLCRDGTTDRASLISYADALFVEVSYTNPVLFRQLMIASLGDVACRAHETIVDCNADSAHQCLWNDDLKLCWSQCVYATQAECNADRACDWDTDLNQCNKTMTLALACTLQATTDDCALIEKPQSNASGCFWDEENRVCRVDVDCSEYTLQTKLICETNGCQWNNTNSHCEDFPFFSLPEPAIMQVFSDGTHVKALRFHNHSPEYRFDPNQIFASLGTRVGTGQSGANYGLGFLMQDRAAAIPHTYLYRRPGESGKPPQCGLSQTVVFWQQGEILGEMDSVASLLEVQGNLTTSSDEPIPGRPALVGYPHMIKRTAEPDQYRITFGKSPIESPDLSDCEASQVEGEKFYDMLFEAMPVMLANSPTPLANRVPMEIWMTDVSTQSNPPAVSRRGLFAPANTYPCRRDTDCRDQQVGSCNMTTRKCTNAFTVEGYMPRLIEHNDVDLNGRAVVFSHVTCDQGFGRDCDAVSKHVDYDLILARMELNDFRIEKASIVANDPNIHEVDAFIVGNVFSGFGSTSDLFFLGIQPVSQSVNTTQGTYAVSLPVFGFYHAQLSFGANGWTVSTGPDRLFEGSMQTVSASMPCRLGGANDLTVTSSWELSNPLHFKLSPNGRYLAFARTVQVLECKRMFSLGDPTDELQLGMPTKSDILIIDLAVDAGTALPIYASSCVDNVHFFSINLMPVFISDSQQLFFSSRPTGSDPFYNKFYRYNLENLSESDPGCFVTEVVNSDLIKEVLTQDISEDLVPLGASLNDSRTFIAPNCNCQQGTWDIWCLAGLMLFFWLRRNRH